MSKVRQIQETSYLVENEYKALPPEVSSEVAELNDMVGALILDWKEPTQLPPPVCVPSRCGISTKLYSGYRPRWSQIKIRPPGFPLHSTNPHANNFERLSQANRCSVKKHAKPRNSLSILHNPQMANLTDMLSKFVTTNTASTSGSGTLPGNTVTNPKEDLKGITTRSGVTIQGPKAVNLDTESRNPNPEPNVSPVDTPIPKASIPFPSRRNDENRREKANEQIEKFYEIFKDMNFEISFLDALTLMPKFASTLKALIGNKEKLSEMAKLNETCSAVILNKLHLKLGDPGRFLIHVIFYGFNTCNALADLGCSIILAVFHVEEAFIGTTNTTLFQIRRLFTETKMEIKLCEAKTVKSSIGEPQRLNSKDLHPHLDTAFLEDDNKLPVSFLKRN
ncbi:hypothetical protein Tco_1406187 [Tanacetum coccineum]